MDSQSSTRNVVLITGANQGIGYQVAKQIAMEHRDYHVLMGSRDPERGAAAAAELLKEGLSVEVLNIDITDDKSIEAAVKEVSSRYGRLDVLVNNAGISNDAKLNSSEDSVRSIYQEQFNTNVFGTAQVTEAFLSLLQESLTPRIVFTSSTLGSLALRTDDQNKYYTQMLPVYRASKAALNMLCLHYAAKYKEKGWKVNTVDPGHVATSLNRFKGPDPVEKGAIQLVRMATWGPAGPTGTFSSKEGPVPW